MTWTEVLEGAEFLRKLFPEPPSLEGVRIFSIALNQDGPTVLLGFDLKEFPAQPPPKWVEAEANRVQLKLMAIGVRQLEIHGWTANNIAQVEIAAVSGGGVRIQAVAEGFSFLGLFDHLRLDTLSAYTSTEAG
jgi:hypothetical protein